MTPTSGRFSYVTNWRDKDSSSSSSSDTEYIYENDTSAYQEGGDSEDFAGGDTPDSDE